MLPLCLALLASCFTACSSREPAKDNAEQPAARVAKESKAAATPLQDEPAAHALYQQMVEAMRKAKSLSYVSRSKYWWEGRDEPVRDCTYRVWLKKPNYFRVEAEFAAAKDKPKDTDGGRTGVLVGDGRTLWTYWPQGRGKYDFEERAVYDKTRLTSYMTKPAPPGGHSIGHAMCYMGPRPILDPSTFHGYTDSLQSYFDGVRSLGSEKVGSEDCDKIELSIMKHQRSWFLWLSKRDRLPRKLKEIIRVDCDHITNEEWSSVTVNADVADTMFAWKPPKGWTEWKMPPIEIGLLKPGAKAPDFDLASADGGRIKLSDYRGKVEWIYVWRAG